MKYKLTWKDVILTNLSRFIFIGFPIFCFFVVCVTFLIQIFEGNVEQYSLIVYIEAIREIFPTIVFVYSCVVLAVFLMSFRFWKNTIIGEHELSIDEEFFIWKSKKQEVKTKLSLLKDFTVKRNALVIKFEGIRKAKILRKWIQEGYDEFVMEMTQTLTKKK